MGDLKIRGRRLGALSLSHLGDALYIRIKNGIIGAKRLSAPPKVNSRGGSFPIEAVAKCG